jgi:hypothetical protein
LTVGLLPRTPIDFPLSNHDTINQKQIVDQNRDLELI